MKEFAETVIICVLAAIIGVLITNIFNYALRLLNNNTLKRYCGETYVKIKKFLKKPQEKNKKSIYTDLTPIDNIDGEQESIKALHWALNNYQVKNIALTGPYGSGKSSVINSYLKLHKECRAIKISLATFDGYTWDEISELQEEKKYDEAKILLKESEDELEKGILKQLFYGVNADKIPLSRYRKLHHVKFWKYIVSILLLCAVVFSALYLAMPNRVLDFYEKNYSSRMGSVTDMAVILTTVLFLVFGTGYLLKVITSKFTLKEISVGDASFQGEEFNTDSVLNKNIDEMLYFFEKTKYNVIFIEDLDRFNTTSIFVKLRELNTILNNYEVINRRIVFVYAVKDNLFKNESERTKFFDFIIPVIPVINSTNSDEIMRRLLGMGERKVEDREYPEHKISDKFITIMAPFISDMRILINTINEFWIYKKTLLDEHKDYMNDECMLALMLYKNMYPDDFALLECGTGNIKAAFEFKEEAMKYAKENLEFQRKQLECRQKDTLKSLKELKIVLFSELVNNQGIILHITINSKKYDYMELLEDKFDFDLLRNNSLDITYKENNSRYSDSKHIDVLSEYNKIVEELCIRYDAQCAFKEKQDEELLLEFEKLDRSIMKLRANSVQQLLADNPKEEVLPESVYQNEILVLMLRHGYINENYADYINHFYPGSISKEELNFILSIRNFRSLNDFAFSITHRANVAEKILDYEFEQKEALNFDITDFLLENRKSNEVKLSSLVKQLIDRSELSLRFIKEYIDRNRNVTQFMQVLCHASGHIWEDLENDTGVSKEAKDNYLKMIIDACDIETIKKNNYVIKDIQIGGIRNYIEKDKQILTKLSGSQNSKLKEVIEELGICFYSTDFKGIDRELFDFIIENRCYKLNPSMIHEIFRIINPKCLPELFRNNFHWIEESECDALIDYVCDDMSGYVTNIILNDERNTEENTKDVETIVKRLLDFVRQGTCKKDLCIKMIEKEHLAYWEQLSSCLTDCMDEEKKDIWDYILVNQRTAVSWDNYIEYHKRFGITDTLVEYADDNMCGLIHGICEEQPTDNMIKELLTAYISIDSFSALVKAYRVKEFTNSFDEFHDNEIEIMIEEHYFDFMPELYTALKQRAGGFHIEFATANKRDFFEQIDECNIDIIDVKRLLGADIFNEHEIKLLLDCISPDDVDRKLALQIRELEVAVPQEFVCAAWDVLDDEEKYQLLLNQLDAFSLDELAHRFGLLGGPYNQLSERTRHKYKLFASEYNGKICQRLYDRGFLSSCDVEEGKVRFDLETNKEVTDKYVVGYVKKKILS